MAPLTEDEIEVSTESLRGHRILCDPSDPGYRNKSKVGMSFYKSPKRLIGVWSTLHNPMDPLCSTVVTDDNFTK